MKGKLIILICSLAICVLQISCSSCKKESPCVPQYQSQVGFNICEVLKDTFLLTDTSYAYRYLIFHANDYNDSVKLQIGNDPRIFTNSKVSLFFRNPETINVSYSAVFNNGCTIASNNSTKLITLVKYDSNNISPLAGTYLGYNIDNPNDTFRIAVKFWIGPRYPFWKDGAYTLENLPKGYHAPSTRNFNGYYRPEITGLEILAGYKNMSVDDAGSVLSNGIKGYASLIRGNPDTIVFNYRQEEYIYTPTFDIRYHNKKFIGIRK